jgi:hypothetical protein
MLPGSKPTEFNPIKVHWWMVVILLTLMWVVLVVTFCVRLKHGVKGKTARLTQVQILARPPEMLEGQVLIINKAFPLKDGGVLNLPLKVHLFIVRIVDKEYLFKN